MVYCYAFLKPVFLLQSDGSGLPLKVAMATLFLLFYISVSELFGDQSEPHFRRSAGRKDFEGRFASKWVGRGPRTNGSNGARKKRS
jgi:hypothetical protein